MRLAYRAYDQSGNEVLDSIEAADSAAAVEALRPKGLYVVDISEAGVAPSAKGKGVSLSLGGGRRLKDLAIFARQLSVLVSSGTQVVEALGALERQTKPGPWQDVISSVRLSVEQGSTLAESMEAHKDYFDTVCCSLIAAGESSGDLAAMLDRLAALKQKQLRVRNAIVGAMVYPCLLVVIALSVLSLLLVFVVPRFADLFKTLSVPLPPTTRALVGVSSVFRAYWWAITIGLGGAAVGAVTYLKTPAGKLAWDMVVLRLPQVGGILKNFAVARVTRVLGVLMESHVPVLEALRLTRASVANVHYQALLDRARDMVIRGESISSAFADPFLVSASVHEAIRSGERSGQTGPLLLTVADFLDEENEVVVRSLTSIIEPVILVLMGLVVGLVAISMFLPLFDLTSMTGAGG